MNIATLRLFNVIRTAHETPKKTSKALMERMIRNGYILDPRIPISSNLLDEIETVVGISGEKANASFHKSWKVVCESSMETLVLQQIMHYITTYGFEEWGIYRDETVYIPNEVLKLPKLKKNLSFVVIKAATSKVILAKILELGSGVALSEQTLNDIMAIVGVAGYKSDFVSKIGNSELKVRLYDFYGLVPEAPEEFLRYAVSKLTGETLLIKNKALTDKLKVSDFKVMNTLMAKAPKDLASIFFRYKPLFLAMKTASSNPGFFNRLRKQADKLHKPVPPDYLNSITSQIKGDRLDLVKLEKRLRGASVFRKVRLANALCYRTNSNDSIVYRVRNGRGWASDFEWAHKLKGSAQQALDVVEQSIAEGMEKKVKGKTFYIPTQIHYVLPATEKQFMGNIPSGSSIRFPQDVVVGIHWTDTDKRVDLDLSALNGSNKVGWDASFRTGDVLFSGDNTSAPKPDGASELFHIRHSLADPHILMVNYYNMDEGDEVDCKVLVAYEKPDNFGESYMVDPNNIVMQANIRITQKQNVVGLIAPVQNEIGVYFTNTSVGTSITAGNDQHVLHARNYLVGITLNPIYLRKILKLAGAKVVGRKPKETFVDLSPEVLDKTTLINLIT